MYLSWVTVVAYPTETVEHRSRSAAWTPIRGVVVSRRVETVYETVAEIDAASWPITADDRAQGIITLRRDGECASCGRGLAAGARAKWSRHDRGHVYCASQARCAARRAVVAPDRRTLAERAAAYCDGDERALGCGPEEA